MKKQSRFLNDGTVERNWFGKNYYWLGTIFVVAACILLYAIGGMTWSFFLEDVPVIRQNKWFLMLFVHGIFSCFSHINWQHVLLNMLCFAVVGIYLERKLGTLKLLLLIFAICLNCTAMLALFNGVVGGIGYSQVNFALYFYIAVDYIFLFFQKGKSASSIVLGTIVVALIYFAMCFNGGASSFGFEWYPYDLLNNTTHKSGAFAGLLIVLPIKFSTLGKNEERWGLLTQNT